MAFSALITIFSYGNSIVTGLPIVIIAISTVLGTCLLLLLVLLTALTEYQILASAIKHRIRLRLEREHDDTVLKIQPTALPPPILSLISIALVVAALWDDGSSSLLISGPYVFYAAVVTALINLIKTICSTRGLTTYDDEKKGKDRGSDEEIIAAFVGLVLDVLATLVIAYGVAHLLLMRRISLWATIIYVTCCWNTDNGALWFGSIGGPKDPFKIILPRKYRHCLQIISPKKTITGVIGGILLGALTGLIVGYLRFKGLFTSSSSAAANDNIILLPWSCTSYFALGGLIGIFAQSGDLLESFLKRAAHVKNSGSLLPGHGGILDRIDSLLLGAPLYVHLLSRIK